VARGKTSAQIAKISSLSKTVDHLDNAREIGSGDAIRALNRGPFAQRRPTARSLGLNLAFRTQSSMKSPYPIAPGGIPFFLARASHSSQLALNDLSG
jgi:hypothetical protein